MVKLNFTKREVEIIKSQIYLTEEESQILELWLNEYSIVEISFKLNMSERTISRRKESILRKILRVV